MSLYSKLAATICLTLAAGAVSNSAMAEATCRNTCDTSHVACMNAGKSDDNVCLPQWRQCKTACVSGPTKPAPTPVVMTSKPAPIKR